MHMWKVRVLVLVLVLGLVLVVGVVDAVVVVDSYENKRGRRGHSCSNNCQGCTKLKPRTHSTKRRDDGKPKAAHFSVCAFHKRFIAFSTAVSLLHLAFLQTNATQYSSTQLNIAQCSSMKFNSQTTAVL